jgi:hypothetical protein
VSRNDATFAAFSRWGAATSEVTVMGRGLLLWLIGIPLPIILLLFLFGVI